MTGLFFIWGWLLLGIIGGTPEQRISEGLFCFLFFWFWVFIGIIGGTPDKRIYEGLFCPLFFLLVLGFYRNFRRESLTVYFAFWFCF